MNNLPAVPVASHLHEFEDDDLDVMLIETFVYNVDIVFFVYHHVPLDAFQMMIYEQILCHTDDIGKNVNHSADKEHKSNRKEDFSFFFFQKRKTFSKINLTWIRICRTSAPFCLNIFLHKTHCNANKSACNLICSSNAVFSFKSNPQIVHLNCSSSSLCCFKWV